MRLFSIIFGFFSQPGLSLTRCPVVSSHPIDLCCCTRNPLEDLLVLLLFFTLFRLEKITGHQRFEQRREKSPNEESPNEESPKKESPKKESPKKESPKKESPKKESPTAVNSLNLSLH